MSTCFDAVLVNAKYHFWYAGGGKGRDRTGNEITIGESGRLSSAGGANDTVMP